MNFCKDKRFGGKNRLKMVCNSIGAKKSVKAYKIPLPMILK
jgi:hypothetical protein